MFDMRLLYLCYAFLVWKSTLTVGLYTCYDENNNPVDWFVMYKIPKVEDHPNPLIANGEAYTYITSGSDDGWVLSSKSVNDSSSMPALTLATLYNNPQDFLYILYNDQPPQGKWHDDGGHTKGVVLADGGGGVWLVHSVPHYPPSPEDGYSYPHTGLRYGQSYLCITILADQLEHVGTLLTYNKPHIFAKSTPASLQDQYPTLTKAADGLEVHSPPWYHTGPLVSNAGATFHGFAKSPEFKKDLYSDWVAAALEVNLLVETWPNGPGRLDSSCHKPYKVENVEGVKLSAVGGPFSSHKDHSKWAVSETKDNPFVCIGDINRAESQAERGGGTVCLKDEALWQAYYDSVSSVDACHDHHHHHYPHHHPHHHHYPHHHHHPHHHEHHHPHHQHHHNDNEEEEEVVVGKLPSL